MLRSTRTAGSRRVKPTDNVSVEAVRTGREGASVFFLVGAGLTLFTWSVCLADVIIVDLGGGGDHTEIQPAMDAAFDGDTVLVKPGEYVIAAPLTFRGKAITVTGENGALETRIRMSDVPLDPCRASVVVFDSGERETSVLRGFTLAGGTGVGDPSTRHGGGVYFEAGSAPTLVNCTITGNSAYGRGGGVYCRQSSPALTGCTIKGNSARHDGGGMYLRESSPVLTGCTITGNSAQGRGGGGVYVRESSPVLTGCTIAGNAAQGLGGGVHCWASSPLLTNCTITANSAERRGGGVYCGLESSPTLTNCIVWDNLVVSIYTERSTPRVSFSCIEGSEVWPGEGNTNADPLFCGWDTTAVFVDDQQRFEETLSSGFSLALSADSPCVGSGAGGVNMGADPRTCVRGERHLLVRLAPGRYSIDGLDLVHRVSLEGAGEADTVIEGTVLGLRTGSSVSRLTVTAGNRGGIRVSRGQAPEIVSCTLTGNSGSGVYCSRSSPLVKDCTITGNSTEARGGGVYCSVSSSPTVVNCAITDNMAFGSGGGVFSFDGSVSLVNCTITGNSSLSGGGVSCLDGSVSLVSCTITGNFARGDGGGVSARRSSPTLTNCAIAGNSADSGGGAYFWDSAPILVNCTIVGNSATEEGGGLSFFGSAVHLTNCIVQDHPVGSIWLDADSRAQVTYSCIDTRDVWPGLGNINLYPRFEREGIFDFQRVRHVEIGGRLRELPDFVVEAPDYRLQPRSPCIDSGTLEGAPETDLEENGRPCGAGVDMGAFEMGGCPSVRFLRGDCNGDANANLSDAVCILNWLFAGGRIPGCVAAVNTNGDSEVDLSDAFHLLGFFFGGGPPPSQPFPECAPGGLQSDRTLGCESPPAACGT